MDIWVWIRANALFRNLAQGAALFLIVGGLYALNLAIKREALDDYVHTDPKGRRSIRISGYKDIAFNTTLGAFRRRPPCNAFVLESDNQDVTVLGCKGGARFGSAGSVGFYFIDGTLQRIGLVFTEVDAGAVTSGLIEKYGPPWTIPSDRKIASAKITDETVDFMWGDAKELTLRSGNKSTMVLYSSPEYGGMLDTHQKSRINGNL